MNAFSKLPLSTHSTHALLMSLEIRGKCVWGSSGWQGGWGVGRGCGGRTPRINNAGPPVLIKKVRKVSVIVLDKPG